MLRIMPLKNQNHFHCDLPECDVEFSYDPGGPNKPPPNWPDGIRARLAKVVAVTYPLTAYTTFYCGDVHAVEAIGRGLHMPPLPKPDLTASATDADVKNAARAKAIVDNAVRTMPRTRQIDKPSPIS